MGEGSKFAYWLLWQPQIDFHFCTKMGHFAEKKIILALGKADFCTTHLMFSLIFFKNKKMHLLTFAKVGQT